MLAIVIPTLNAAATLPGTLASLRDASPAGPAHAVIVSDGGSRDGTPALARAAGATVIEGPPGRGTQLAAGARAAAGDWLLFMHADTRLSAGWAGAVAAHCARPDAVQRAAYFRFALDDGSAQARRVAVLVALRCRLAALPYGDQGLLIARALYEQVGGYRPLPLMEDVDLVRRLGRRRLVALDAVATTSAARYRRDGWWLRPLRNLGCLALWFAGMHPERIAKLYR